MAVGSRQRGCSRGRRYQRRRQRPSTGGGWRGGGMRTGCWKKDICIEWQTRIYCNGSPTDRRGDRRRCWRRPQHFSQYWFNLESTWICYLLWSRREDDGNILGLGGTHHVQCTYKDFLCQYNWKQSLLIELQSIINKHCYRYSRYPKLAHNFVYHPIATMSTMGFWWDSDRL